MEAGIMSVMQPHESRKRPYTNNDSVSLTNKNVDYFLLQDNVYKEKSENKFSKAVIFCRKTPYLGSFLFNTIGFRQ